MNNDSKTQTASEDFQTGQMEDFSLAAYLQPGIIPDEIEVLQIAKNCSSLFPIFKELVRNQITDFWIKLSILLIFSHDRYKTSWSPQELTTELHWLQENQRKKIMTQLSRSNWLCYNNGNYHLSSFGRNILSMMMTLVQQEDAPDALGANVSSLSLLEMYQSDPTNTLRMFLNELIRIDDEIQQGLESKSEYLIRRLNKRIRSQFAIAIKSREHLENLSTDDFQTYRLKQQIHEHLSSFHSRLSQVQRIQNDLIARRIILADKSLSQHDISSFLINASVDELAELGRSFTSYPVMVRDLVPSLMIYETEWQLEKERVVLEKKGWSPVESADESSDAEVEDSRFFNFVGEVEHSLNKHDQFSIEKFVPQENWTTSAFRFTMLSVMESSELPSHLNKTEGAIPRLDIELAHDGAEVPSELLDDPMSGVKEITKGIVRRDEDRKGIEDGTASE